MGLAGPEATPPSVGLTSTQAMTPLIRPGKEDKPVLLGLTGTETLVGLTSKVATPRFTWKTSTEATSHSLWLTGTDATPASVCLMDRSHTSFAESDRQRPHLFHQVWWTEATSLSLSLIVGGHTSFTKSDRGRPHSYFLQMAMHCGIAWAPIHRCAFRHGCTKAKHPK